MKFLKLDWPFSTAVHFFAYSLTVLKPTEVIVDTFSLLLKCRSRSQQTSDRGWRVILDSPKKKIHFRPAFQIIELNAKYL